MATANANVKKVLDSLKSKGTIVEEWHEGTEWYRVWSSGLIEQGGVAVTTNAMATVTLRKAYSDTNYHATAMIYEGGTNNGVLGAKYSFTTPKSTSSITFKCTYASDGTSGPLNGSNLTWSTVGY